MFDFIIFFTEKHFCQYLNNLFFIFINRHCISDKVETFSHLNSADVNNGVKWVVLLHFHHIKDSGSHGLSRCWENCFYVMREISCVAPFQRVTHSKSFSFLILIFLSNVAYQFNPKKCILLCLIKTFWHPIISPG